MAMTLKKKLMTGTLAEESQKTKKARKKLQEKLDFVEKKMTPQAIERKSQEISRWIARHASDRVSVKKDISLFDKNQNPAQPSKNISKIAEELSKEADKYAVKPAPKKSSKK